MRYKPQKFQTIPRASGLIDFSAAAAVVVVAAAAGVGLQLFAVNRELPILDEVLHSLRDLVSAGDDEGLDRPPIKRLLGYEWQQQQRQLLLSYYYLP